MIDVERRNTFVKDNMGLVYMVAKKFCGRGVEFEDIVQIGSVGLIKASERFDSKLNIKFSTYAVAMIIGEIKRYLRDDGLIKIPRNIKENSSKILRATDFLRNKLNREPTVTEIGKYVGIDTEKVVEALEATRPCESIFAENDNSLPLYETIADEKETNLETEEKMFLKGVLNSLDARLRQIIVLRFFKDKTQSEVGKIMNISQVQVSRLEKKALEILRYKSK